MKPDAADPPARGAASREAEYYQTIEQEFVSRSGGPLTLSNVDWLLMRRWRKAGVPLRIVLRGVRDALDAHALSFDRGRPVGSLRYCVHEVERARERWHRSLSPGEGAGISSDLERLACKLEPRTDLPARAAAEVARIVKDLRSMADHGRAPAETEARLAASEMALLRTLKRALGPEAVAALEAEIEGELAPYGGRMPEGVMRQMRAEGLARRLFERFDLPRLTLFHLG